MTGYLKTNWINSEDHAQAPAGSPAAPKINAANLDKLETGLEHALGLDTAADIRALGVPTTVFTVYLRHPLQAGVFVWDEAATEAEDGVNGAAGTVIQPNAVPVGRWLRQYIGAINPDWWGVDNGIQALQAAADLAAGNAGTILINSNYDIDAKWIIRSGVKKIFSNGGKITALNNLGGILLLGKQSGATENLKNLIIDGFEFDGGGFDCVGIWAENSSFVTVRNCKIKNIVDGYGVLFRSYLAGGENTKRVIIEDNEILLNNNSNGISKHAISIDALLTEFPLNGYANEVDYWKGEFSAVKPTYFGENCVIKNNETNGGYYGISLVGATNCKVMGNTLQNNTRGISQQHRSEVNFIVKNRIYGNASSGIHTAFGSNSNVITKNIIRAFSDGGEALIQFHSGSTDNIAHGNHLFSNGTAGNQFGIYCGIKSNGCIIRSNTLVGNFLRAGIAVESAWNNSTTELTSYGNGKPDFVNGFTNGGISDVTISKNSLKFRDRPVPAIALLAISDNSGNYHVDDIKIHCNEVLNNVPGQQIKIFEAGGSQVRSIQLLNNDFYELAGVNRYIFPRGWGHFSRREGNGKIDKSLNTLPDGVSSPSLLFGDFFSCANSSPTQITSFANIRDNQQFTIKLDINTTIVNDSSRIRLRGGVDATGNGNNMITFRVFAGIAFEQSRNY